VLVAGGAAVSLAVGVVSIRVASDLAAAAAPPPAPPVSLADLQADLAAEHAREADLQAQLDELLGVTAQLSAALDATGDQVSLDGLTADQLRDRLAAAEAKLARITELLRQAQKRLAELRDVQDGNNNETTATPRPDGQSLDLTLAVAGSGVAASWTSCSAEGFDSYALVRSTDHEVHYPPEDHDTLIARIPGRQTTDAAATGTVWYRVYCLASHDGETRQVAASATESISAP
jgi:hypothetical protein